MLSSSSSEDEQARIAACQEVCQSFQSGLNKNERKITKTRHSKTRKIKSTLKIDPASKNDVINTETCHKLSVLESYLATIVDFTPDKKEIDEPIILYRRRKFLCAIRQSCLALEPSIPNQLY